MRRHANFITKALLSAVWITVSFGVMSASPSQPKNIIMVVGDGMGPAFISAYRMYVDDPATLKVEPTVFDRLLVGMASTHPDATTGYVTDSAAGATALSTGHKTYNGAIAVDTNEQDLLTVLEQAKILGLRTGIAVTSQINHATPAGFSSHNKSRHNYDQIADSYFDNKIAGQFVLDVMLGGGWKFFLREDRDLVAEFKQAGYQYVDKLENLDLLTLDKPTLGLFADKGLPWALDSVNKSRLPILTKTAVKQLENPKGFFLLVEASQIDWAGHANDIAAAMTEMHDLAITIEWLEQYAKNRGDTLVVITADHSTGGLTIGAKGEYNWFPTYLKQIQSSPEVMAKKLLDLKNRRALAEKLLGFELTNDEVASLDIPNTAKSMHKTLNSFIDHRTKTGWTTTGHTGVDVPVFAIGPGYQHFIGYSDNTDIGQKLFNLLPN